MFTGHDDTAKTNMTPAAVK